MPSYTGLTPAQFSELFVNPTWAGSFVSPETAARAIPVKASCSLIAGGITAMPLRVLRRDISEGAFIQAPADDHPLWWLLNESPNDDMAAAQFWQRVVCYLLLWGQSFARIVRVGKTLNVSELIHYHNKDVQVVCEWDQGRRRNRIVRYILNEDGRYLSVIPEDMLHFRGDMAVGQPPRSAIIESARQAIGLTLAIEEYCGRVFANGATPRVVLKYPAGTKITDEQREIIRDAWIKSYAGSSQAGLPLILAGGDVQKVSFTASEAQMLEARKFQVIDIARAFGVPPFMIGETEKTSAWGTGIEQLGKGFVRFTLSPHMTALEQEVTRKLFRTSRFFVDFDEEALARGDMKSLGDWYRQALGGAQGPGFMAPNEVRRRLNLPPVDGGDSLFEPAGGADNASTEKSTAGADSGEPGQAAAV
jgi:HK97 family phage portal protein